jgi:hypothetical protein
VTPRDLPNRRVPKGSGDIAYATGCIAHTY